MENTLFAFFITFLVLSLNEYRLYKIKSISYKTLINSVAVLLMGLATFIVIQYLFKK